MLLYHQILVNETQKFNQEVRYNSNRKGYALLTIHQQRRLEEIIVFNFK